MSENLVNGKSIRLLRNKSKNTKLMLNFYYLSYNAYQTLILLLFLFFKFCSSITFKITIIILRLQGSILSVIYLITHINLYNCIDQLHKYH